MILLICDCAALYAAGTGFQVVVLLIIILCWQNYIYTPSVVLDGDEEGEERRGVGEGGLEMAHGDKLTTCSDEFSDAESEASFAVIDI